MTLDVWATFIAVVFVFAIIPGPTVILVVGQAISHGKKSVIPLVLGVLLGDFVAMSLSLIGLGAILATSAGLFLGLKWIGAGYLIYLGIKTWREQPKLNATPFGDPAISRAQLFKSSFLVTALNPKGIVFFVAFLPQFIQPNAAVLPQLLILMFTFLGVISITISSFATFAGVIRHRIQSHQARKNFNRIGGGALISAGLLTSTMQRNS